MNYRNDTESTESLNKQLSTKKSSSPDGFTSREFYQHLKTSVLLKILKKLKRGENFQTHKSSIILKSKPDRYYMGSGDMQIGKGSQ